MNDWHLHLDNDDYCENGDYPSMDSELSLASPETSLSPRPASQSGGQSPRPTSLTESMQVRHILLNIFDFMFYCMKAGEKFDNNIVILVSYINFG